MRISINRSFLTDQKESCKGKSLTLNKHDIIKPKKKLEKEKKILYKVI